MLFSSDWRESSSGAVSVRASALWWPFVSTFVLVETSDDQRVDGALAGEEGSVAPIEQRMS